MNFFRVNHGELILNTNGDVNLEKKSNLCIKCKKQNQKSKNYGSSMQYKFILKKWQHENVNNPIIYNTVNECND